VTPGAFLIRRATRDDAAVIARHRAEMFRDMGTLPASLYDALVAESIRYLETAIPEGEYIGWLASARETSDTVIAGAGVQRRRTLPHPPRDPGLPVALAYGYQAIVLNVFTERAWRRHGLARRLMEEILVWAREARLDTLVLHASPQGRALYESLGFVQTNEMRYARDLADSADPTSG
jgi:GNAT superfamily N-acetyltransferase